MERADVIVIGGGVVGLAIARAFAQASRSVLVLEKSAHLASETSARNSGVIHAGLYYPPGSLKAITCVRGKHLLYSYCEARSIPHIRCGKLIVAQTDAECARLHDLIDSAQACGVQDLVLLSKAEATRRFPDLRCTSALYSPSTGVIDPHAYAQALEADCLAAGAEIVGNTRVEAVARRYDRLTVVTEDEAQSQFVIQANTVINAAGLTAPDLTRTFEVETARRSAPETYFGKGHYYAYTGPVPFDTLVYPLPGAGGLGIHMTRGVDGTVRFGPDISWADRPDYAFEDTPARRNAFTIAIQRYWPTFQPDKLQPDSTGVRPKLSSPGDSASDFVVHTARGHHVPGYIALYGIESPGLTASLALAEHVVALADDDGS